MITSFFSVQAYFLSKSEAIFCKALEYFGKAECFSEKRAGVFQHAGSSDQICLHVRACQIPHRDTET
jgi:hypothetical protein